MKAGSGWGEGFWEVGYTELDLGGKVTEALWPASKLLPWMAGCLGMSRGPLKGNGGRAARCGWGGESELSDKHVEFAHRMQNSGCKQEPGT